MMTANALEIGKTYLVKHQRKGNFTLKLTDISGEWVSGIVMDGRVEANLPINEATQGDEVTVRRAFCVFTEQPSNVGVKAACVAGRP